MPDNLQETMEAIGLLIENLSEQESEHVVSFALEWPTETKNVRLSVLGHVHDLCKWLDEFSNKIPQSDDQIGIWLEDIRGWLEENYPDVPQGIPPIEKILLVNGILRIKRVPLPKDLEIDIYYSKEKKALMYRFKYSREMKHVAEALQNSSLYIAPAFLVNSSECSICGSNYFRCPHSKFLASIREF